MVPTRHPLVCISGSRGSFDRKYGSMYGGSHKKKARALLPGLRLADVGLDLKNLGGVLLSHSVTRAVPSTLKGLTSVFEMGTGVTPSLWPPRKT